MIQLLGVSLSESSWDMKKEATSGILNTESGRFEVNILSKNHLKDFEGRPFVKLKTRVFEDAFMNHHHTINYYGKFQNDDTIIWDGPNPEIILKVLGDNNWCLLEPAFIAGRKYAETNNELYLRQGGFKTMREFFEEQKSSIPKFGSMIKINSTKYLIT